MRIVRGFLAGTLLAIISCLILTIGVAPALVQAFAQEKKMMEKGKMEMKEKSLYDRLGGKKAIKAVVDEFVSNVGADTKINHFFAHTDLKHLKMMLVDQICAATGGPCKYKGKDMKSAHKGMGITEADFNALVGDLVTALDKFKVGEKEKNELLGALGGMKGDIVEK
jgi:hemoglobin